MNMRICCYDLVGVDSKTLVSFLLFYFTLFSLCFLFFFYQKSISQVFGTRLRFNKFRDKFVFQEHNSLWDRPRTCNPLTVNDFYTCVYI
jgi:hypothetical protein